MKMETIEDVVSEQLGNSAAMREALEALVGMIDECNSGNPLWWHIGAKGVKQLKDARAALATPPRNCDVGTSKEQSARFDAHCRKHMGCLTCPLREKDGGVPKHCELAWAQMPYEEVK